MLFSITTFHFSLYLHFMNMHEQYFSLYFSLLSPVLNFAEPVSNWRANVAWFHGAEHIMLYHAAPVLAPDRQADMWSREGPIKVNYDC